MVRLYNFFIIIGILFFTNCATIFSKYKYPIRINSTPSGAKVTITDKEGILIHKDKTPTILNLKSGKGYFSRAYYNIKFEKEEYKTETLPIKFKIDRCFYLNNILITLMIVDALTGAMYELDQETLYKNLLKFNLNSNFKVELRQIHKEESIPIPLSIRLTFLTSFFDSKYDKNDHMIARSKIELQYLFLTLNDTFRFGIGASISNFSPPSSVGDYKFFGYSFGGRIGWFIYELGLVTRINFNKSIYINLNLGASTIESVETLHNPSSFFIDIDPTVFFYERFAISLRYRYQEYYKGSSNLGIGLSYDFF